MQKNSNAQAYRHELKYRIMRKAMPLFKEKGIKAVRMDDIAASLSISKRTLYEIYATKEELLLECVKLDAYDMKKRIQDYSMTAENEIDIVVTFFRFKFSDFDNLSPSFISDLEKYSTVKDFLRKKHEEQQEESIIFIKKCIENGFFVPEINYNLIQDLNDSIMNSGVIAGLSGKYKLRDIFYNFFIVLLRGFCTESGLALLDRYLKKSAI